MAESSMVVILHCQTVGQSGHGMLSIQFENIVKLQVKEIMLNF